MKVERIKSSSGTHSLLPHWPLAASASQDGRCQIMGQIPFLHLLLLKKTYIPGWFFWSLEIHSSPCRNGTARAQTRCLFPQDATVMAPVCFAASMRKGLSLIIPQGHGKSEGKLFLASPPLGFVALNRDRHGISKRSKPGRAHASCQSGALEAARWREPGRAALPRPCNTAAPPAPTRAPGFCVTAKHPFRGAARFG